MRILVVGGGPGGLYFSILLKRQDPAHEIHVVEQNPAGATYGWGVAFTSGAIDALRPDAPDIFDELIDGQRWGGQMNIDLDGSSVLLDGFGMYRVARVRLLDVLERHAADVGVRVQHDVRIEDVQEGYDLVVGADGVNSAVRSLHSSGFEPQVRNTKGWWAWYGTRQPFPAVSLLFQHEAEGLAIGHAYGYTPELSGFVVEVTPEYFERAGLAQLNEEESRRYCSQLFARHLGDHELISNRSLWFQPRFVTCRNWFVDNVVLLGDALHTVHPSIGSGTRFAMRDSVALARAVSLSGDDPAAAIREYEATRRPNADRFQRAAMRSIAWYEGLAGRQLGSAEMFAIEFAMRTGNVRWPEFRRRNAQLVENFERPDQSLGSHPVTRTARALRAAAQPASVDRLRLR